jgi:hypothetical protein
VVVRYSFYPDSAQYAILVLHWYAIMGRDHGFWNHPTGSVDSQSESPSLMHGFEFFCPKHSTRPPPVH